MTEDYLAIVMEYAAGGDMFQLVTSKRGLSENEARWFFQQLVLGLDYCHKMGIVNRDIKLEVRLGSFTACRPVTVCLPVLASARLSSFSLL